MSVGAVASLTSVGLAESDRIPLAFFAEEKHYPEDTLIFREGDAGDAIYVVAPDGFGFRDKISGGEEAFASRAGEISERWRSSSGLRPLGGRARPRGAIVLELSPPSDSRPSRPPTRRLAELSSLRSDSPRAVASRPLKAGELEGPGGPG